MYSCLDLQLNKKHMCTNPLNPNNMKIQILICYPSHLQ